MRLFCITGSVLLTSTAFLGVLPRQANAQVEPITSTIRLASDGEAISETSEPPSQPWPRRDSELTFEQLHAAADDHGLRSAAPAKTSSPIQRGVRQVGYVDSPATKPLVDVPNFNRSRSLAGVYPSASAQSTLNKLPRPAPVQAATTTPAAQTTHPRGKPFQAVQADPALSPYLNLYRTNLDPNMMPNYFALVRPQLEQQEMNRKQSAEIRQLQKQLQNSPAAAAGTQYSAGSTSGMSASARYMDTGQFYKHTRR